MCIFWEGGGEKKKVENLFILFSRISSFLCIQSLQVDERDWERERAEKKSFFSCKYFVSYSQNNFVRLIHEKLYNLKIAIKMFHFSVAENFLWYILSLFFHSRP